MPQRGGGDVLRAAKAGEIRLGGLAAHLQPADASGRGEPPPGRGRERRPGEADDHADAPVGVTGGDVHVAGPDARSGQLPEVAPDGLERGAGGRGQGERRGERGQDRPAQGPPA